MILGYFLKKASTINLKKEQTKDHRIYVEHRQYRMKKRFLIITK